jgi:hypothetical protein
MDNGCRLFLGSTSRLDRSAHFMPRNPVTRHDNMSRRGPLVAAGVITLGLIIVSIPIGQFVVVSMSGPASRSTSPWSTMLGDPGRTGESPAEVAPGVYGVTAVLGSGGPTDPLGRMITLAQNGRFPVLSRRFSILPKGRSEGLERRRRPVFRSELGNDR